MSNEHYTTAFWENKHPMSEKGEKIQDTYMEMGEPMANAPRGTKGKLRELESLLYRHYRFYNDGDTFRYKGETIGAKYGGKSYYDIESDNKMLKLLEKDIAARIKELWTLTDGATK